MKFYKETAAALLCSLATLTAPNPAHAQAVGYVQNQDAAVASSVRVVAEYSGRRTTYGTGWIIAGADNDRRAGASVVVTALHVLRLKGANLRRVLIITPGEDKPIVASVSETDPERDLVFLEAKNLPMPALKLSTAKTNISQEVGAIGYTGASDRIDSFAKSGSFVEGVVSRLTQAPILNNQYSPRNLIQHSVALNVGFSGGPLVDRCGRVVGVNLQDGGHISLGGGRTLALAQGVAMAISADEVVASANAAGVDVQPQTSVCTERDDGGNGDKPDDNPDDQLPLPCPEGKIRGEDGVCVTKESGIAEFIKSPQGLIALVAFLGLLGAGFALFRILNPRRRQVPPPPPPPPAPPPLRKTITFSGTIPEGQPFTLSFSTDIGEQGTFMGTEAPEGIIPDNRAKPLVSRRHAKVSWNGDAFRIEDEKSTNKTKVNGANLEPYQPRELRDGDTVSFADVIVRVSIS